MFASCGIRPARVPLHELSVAEAREAELVGAPRPLSPRSRSPGWIDRELPGPDCPFACAFVPATGRSPAPRPRVLLRRRLGARLARGRRPRLQATRERDTLRRGLRCVPARAGSTPPRGARGLLRGNAMGRFERRLELGIDAHRVAVGGASAGGNLAAAVALLARELRATAARIPAARVTPLLDHRAKTLAGPTVAWHPLLFGREDVRVVLDALPRRPHGRRRPAGVATRRADDLGGATSLTRDRG